MKWFFFANLLILYTLALAPKLSDSLGQRENDGTAATPLTWPVAESGSDIDEVAQELSIVNSWMKHAEMRLDTSIESQEKIKDILIRLSELEEMLANIDHRSTSYDYDSSIPKRPTVQFDQPYSGGSPSQELSTFNERMAEKFDSSESSESELYSERVDNSFYEERVRGARLNSVECRGSICKLSYDIDENEYNEMDFVHEMRNSIGADFTIHHEVENGSRRSTYIEVEQ